MMYDKRWRKNEDGKKGCIQLTHSRANVWDPGERCGDTFTDILIFLIFFVYLGSVARAQTILMSG